MADRPVMLVTGASRGIGRYLSEHYLARGYDVIGCSRTAPPQPMPPNFVHIAADVTVAKDIERLFADIRTRCGRLDVAINNAGINSGVALAILTSHEIATKTLMTNVLGTFCVSREAAKLMMRKRFGRIINFSSMAAHHEVEGEAVYAASKAAIQTMTRVMAKEFYRYGITCNAVAPSAVPTDMMESVPSQALKEVLSRNAIPEVGKMEDISNAIDWLIRPESQAITGQVVFLGGV